MPTGHPQLGHPHRVLHGELKLRVRNRCTGITDLVGEEPSEQRSADAGQPEQRPEVAGVAGPLAGETISAMIAWASTINPPAPRPWTARNAMSCSIERDRPLSAPPTRNSTMANWNSRLRPKRSPSLPYSGVETAEVS
jgi:hypothetical protein